MKPLRDLLGEQATVTVEPNATVREAAKAMAAANIGCVAILDGDNLVGMFTERDVLKRVLLQDLRTDRVRVSEVMTREIITAKPEMTSSEGRALLRKYHIRHLPVVDGKGALIGILSIRDLIRDEIRDAREAVEEVQRYLTGGSAFEGHVED